MNIGIFGHGGHAREVYWCLDFAQRVNCKFFVDDEYFQGGENILPISEFEPVPLRVGGSRIKSEKVKKKFQKNLTVPKTCLNFVKQMKGRGCKCSNFGWS